MNLTPTLNQNIIAQAEFRHQRYIINSTRSGRTWILLAILMLLPALLTSLAAWGLALFSGISSSFLDDLVNNNFQLINIGIVLMITMNIALYIVVILITVALSANSINREKQNHTWDVLMLTNIDAGQLVWGKWWASLKALNGDHAMLGILRLGLVGLTVLMNYGNGNLQPGPFGLPIGLTYTLPLTVIILLYTLLDAAFTAALGIAAALSNQPTAVTNTLVLVARVFGIVLMFIHFAVIIRMVMLGEAYLWVAGGGLIIYALLTWGALRVAQMTAIRGQVSPPPEAS